MFKIYDKTKPYYDQMGYGDIVLERFWSKVIVKKFDDGTDNVDDCMEWKSGRFANGYPCFHYKHSFLAHRFIYECFNGPIGKDLVIRHKCDNISCVNPHHLISGTNLENSRDMVERK